MQTTPIQMFVFVQSLVTKIKFPEMELTRVAPMFRNQYKTVRGIPKRATALQVLQDVFILHKELGWTKELETITAYIAKHKIVLPASTPTNDQPANTTV